MKRNDLIEVIIENYAYEGKGIAKIPLKDKPEKKFVVFVNRAYPGDRVKARIYKSKKSYAEANVDEVLESSELRREARCKYFGVCGGCKQQDMKYDAQLKFKEQQVVDIFERMGQLKDFETLPILPSEREYYYRNKMEFSFADMRWLTEDEIKSGDKIVDKNFALGLHIPKMFDRVLDIDECYLQSEISKEIVNFTRDFFKSRNTTIYSTKTHTGFLRNLVIKQSHHSNDLMVNLVTSVENDDLIKEYTKELTRKFPQVTSVINNINLKKAQVAVGDYEKLHFGNSHIYDFIGEYKFKVSANSFFQTNTLQAKNLYQTAVDFADFKGDEIVYDLYSGAGTISIFISGKVGKVYAFENVEDAVKDADENKIINSIKNVEFVNADLNKSVMPVIHNFKLPHPDIIVADPPRGGMNPKTVKDILQINPKKIVYVSCNPTTQVRDIKLLIENGYKLIKIRPVDMFPQTYHIENVALLIKE
ncbi:MAG: 23S rRNA (uracil(1939)-C(5))-methyltransferase RlmD [Melioribacteraceae bacterium]|nr:23S rRNA (uracil(1939)-C(5))-methyltransferase RlmD [Melioribacteraceae bacterium]MCF8356069.1 23S rRNA (uracil(1939)-C(5))-methyltransferase RlmD [Melioribacteraceae bacterium]MCF8394896.1 23S rRNA (uracil(1939)-C(5))-methyltransferase RlmD [Melioribacteraceae bacterium]MCF8420429.1 23S rRNA (uracil(1939)-C(5))-methyltransferase RlmD [Melioribacteraceae bacterium]